MQFFIGNSLWNLLFQSDGMTWFILFSLVATSIGCWSIAFYKVINLKLKIKQTEETIRKMQANQSFEQFVFYINVNSITYPGYFLCESLHATQKIIQKKISKKISYQESESLSEKRFILIDQLIEQENSGVPVLAVAISASPLMGLFGTVWGLMHSFMSIAQKQSADIITIAPGIAEALLTTLAGLVVAIPALILYQWVISNIRKLESEMLKLSDAMQLIIEQNLLEEKDSHENVVSQKTAQTPFAS